MIAGMARELRADVVIVGGGTGGCSAAMAAAAMGRTVILTEETDWLGGQLTSQAVPPDEHPWIEQFGCTRRYRQFREGVRRYYRENYPLSSWGLRNPLLNPGAGNVSRLCHEPRVALAVIEGMLAPARMRGRVQVLLKHLPVAADVAGDRVKAVAVRDLETGEERTLVGEYFLDATELGDLLPLAGVEYVSGAETQKETGEPHAVAEGSGRVAGVGNVQAITWCFPMAFDPAPPEELGDRYVIEKPAQYEKWRDYVPVLTPAWCGKLISWQTCEPVTLGVRTSVLRVEDQTEAHEHPLWLYRRIVAAQNYDPAWAPQEVTLVNWPQNDYLEGNLIDVPEEEKQRALYEAKQLSLSLLYWLQTEAPHRRGCGFRGLHLRPDMTGTADGLAKYPYIRESRRIKALFTVLEQHVGTMVRGGVDPHNPRKQSLASIAQPQAESFHDSVGVGCYRIDLHPSTGKDNYIDVSSLPYQIPLGALIPQRVENLLAACKNIGVTHITNGCYRLHPTEWNIGESAGALAAYCIEKKVGPRAVREDRQRLEDFQRALVNQGVELSWPATRAV